jgi:hypothetical protein
MRSPYRYLAMDILRHIMSADHWLCSHLLGLVILIAEMLPNYWRKYLLVELMSVVLVAVTTCCRCYGGGQRSVLLPAIRTCGVCVRWISVRKIVVPEAEEEKG